MDNEDVIREQMENTRTSLTEKLESLESTVASTVERATSNVAETVEAVQETVATVKDSVVDSVTAVKASVHDSIGAIKEFLDIPGHVERHPWAMLGGAVAVGFFIGSYQNRKPADVQPGTGAEAPYPHAHGNGRSVPREPEPPPAPAFLDRWAPEINKLTGLAVGALMGTVKEMVVQAAPGAIGESLSEIIDTVTEKLGGAPIKVAGENGASAGPMGSLESRSRWAHAN